MTVIILERVPVSVRGELSRWMLEIHAGCFVGSLSATVRDLLWEQVCDQMRDGAGFLVYHTNSL
jgi:CRISPR-associated protein Cas2